MSAPAAVATQQPAWPDPIAVEAVRAELATRPGLVTPGECDALRARLAAVEAGEAFVLQGGDCAETFAGVTAAAVTEKLRLLLQMAVVLTYGASVPVVKVGRIAGQFAKPRSADVEALTGLPSYRGDAVNDLADDPASRVPDPQRMLQAYAASATTLNLLRALTHGGGLADLRRVHAWNRDFLRRSPAGERYEALAGSIDQALGFMRACGVDLDAQGSLGGVEFFASHEALLLDYEQPLVRRDAERGRDYALSGHLVWVGERTRALGGAHLELAASVANPVAVKIGPSATPADVEALADRLDPDRSPGRLTLIARLGCERVRDLLPPLLAGARAAGIRSAWVCDPMHGNTFTSDSGYKTRRFDDVVEEVRGFFAVHREAGTHPGGLHVELTGDNVTECLGGGDDIDHADLAGRYETACDPRLNGGQALELAFLAAEMLRG
jgi:3-deoxy-7-phosphoheptulonate synthase